MVAVQLRPIRPQRHDNDWHVVDFNGLNDPALDDGRHLVRVGMDLVIELDERFFAVLAHIEADGDHALPRCRHGIHILDAVDLVQHLLQTLRDLFLHFLGR